MMTETKEKAYAKLNISLDVTEKRNDGYHNMVMVMQSVSLCDDISICLDQSGRIKARSNFRFIPSDERNLAVKAAARFLRELGDTTTGAEISIRKHIPVGSGMGGGSSDAAAVLRALNRMYGSPFSMEKLTALGAEVGSDVPFCIRGGTALAKGRGELLSPLPPLPPCCFVICKPPFSISTPELFRKLDGVSSRHHPDTAGILEGVEKGDLVRICRRMYNVFEEVDDRRMRSVREIKSSLLDHGALGAVMTGSGSAVFGVFADETKAFFAEKHISNEHLFSCLAHPTPAITE